MSARGRETHVWPPPRASAEVAGGPTNAFEGARFTRLPVGMDLFDLIDEEVLEEQAQQAAAAPPLSAAAPAAAPPLSQPQAQPVQRHALPLLPHERACDAGGGFEAVGGRRADASTKTSYAPPPKQDMTVEKYSQLRIKCAQTPAVCRLCPRFAGLPFPPVCPASPHAPPCGRAKEPRGEQRCGGRAPARPARHAPLARAVRAVFGEGSAGC